MALFEKLWDDLVDRSDTNCRLAGLRKITAPPIIITDAGGGTKKYKRTKSMPAGWSAAVKTPTAPVCKDTTVHLGSVFYPDVVQLGAAFFNKTQPCSGLCSEEAKGKKQPLVT